MNARLAIGLTCLLASSACHQPEHQGSTNDTPTAAGTSATKTPTPTPAPLTVSEEPAANDPGQQAEKALLNGLRWLLRHQNDDGSWSASKTNERCPCADPAYNPKSPYSDRYDEGLTGLALLCFLEAGYSHESKQAIVDTTMGKRTMIGDAIKQGLQWLVKQQHPDGSFSKQSPFLYNEALATMALTEEYGLTHDDYFKGPAMKAVAFLQNAQRLSPTGNGKWGWRYESVQYWLDKSKAGAPDNEIKLRTFESDTSVTGWVVMALDSAARAGLTVDADAFAGALSFTKWATANNGLVGYIDPKSAGATVGGPNDHFVYHPTNMSAIGMCTRILSAHDLQDPFLELASRRLVYDLPTVSADKLSLDYDYWYFGTLALHQSDGPQSSKASGKYWGPWRAAVRDALLALQDHSEHACTNGGWMALDRWSLDGGPLYATAINLLTLEIFYRKG